MADIIIILILLVIIGFIVYRIRKNKQRKDTCYGCPITDCSHRHLDDKEDKAQ